MKIILNPKYEFLRDYLMNLETHFENEGEEIHRGRNVIKKLSVGDLTLCVKKFAPPATARRLKEMFYKSSKGKQAYLRPMLLRERGFESPENVAFVSYRKGLFRTIGYFVRLLSNYRYTMAEIDQCAPEEKKYVERQLRYIRESTKAQQLENGKACIRFQYDGYFHQQNRPA